MEELKKLGGANLVLATAPDSKSMSLLANGLARNGKLMVVGASPDPLNINPLQYISGRITVQGWASGTAKDSEDTMQFSALGAYALMTRCSERVATFREAFS